MNQAGEAWRQEGSFENVVSTGRISANFEKFVNIGRMRNLTLSCYSLVDQQIGLNPNISNIDTANQSNLRRQNLFLCRQISNHADTLQVVFGLSNHYHNVPHIKSEIFLKMEEFVGILSC